MNKVSQITWGRAAVTAFALFAGLSFGCDSGPSAVDPSYVDPSAPVFGGPPQQAAPNSGEQTSSAPWASGGDELRGGSIFGSSDNAAGALSPGRFDFEAGERALANGLMDEAVTMWRRAVEVDPELVEAWERLYQHARAQGLSELQAEACDALLGIPTAADYHDVSFHVECATAQREQGNMERAEHWARRAVELEPARLEPLIALASVLINSGRPAEAVELLDGRVLEEGGGPVEAAALNNLAAGLIQSGDHLRAQSLLERAESLVLPGSTEWSHVQLNLTEVYRHRGDQENLRLTLERILESDPDNAVAQSRLDELR